MPKHKAILLVLISLIIFLFASQNVNAEDKGPIFINSDGSIVGTDKIQRDGNIYSLTDNLYIVPIVVECSNIILDGKGFSLQAMSGWSELVAINLTCTNVTVRNFNITNYGVGILGAWDNNTITNNTFGNVIRAIAIYANNYNTINNTIQKSTYGIRILNSTNNCFFQNLLISNFIGFDAANSSGNLAVENYFEDNNQAFRINVGSFQVYHNNFVNQYREVSKGNYAASILLSFSASILWDNGYPSGGNYYSDYLTRYPNASEIDNSGIGNIAYQVSIDSNLTDRYPLLAPVNISRGITQLPSPNPDASTSPSPESTIFPTPAVTSLSPTVSTTPSSSPTQPTLSPEPTATVPEFPVWIILPLTIVMILMIMIIERKKLTQTG